MTDTTKIVRDYYDENAEAEWNRIAGRPEFILTCRYIDRYARKGQRVLDVGGGPGRYSLYLAEKGCDVTLLDLSGANVRFAREQAQNQGLPLNAVEGDARLAHTLVDGLFDHVLLMGPMYHLLEEAERIQAVDACLRVLKPGGCLFVSFINMFAGVIYAMKYDPACIFDAKDEAFYQSMLLNQSNGGDGFTKSFFIAQHEVLPFMARFPLEKLHFFGQEGIMSPCEQNLMSQPLELVSAWLDLAEKLSEREDLLSWSEHLMYVGRKIG